MTHFLRNCALLVAALAASATTWAAGDSAEPLRSRYTQLRETLDHSAFGRPLALESAEHGRTQQGDVYAVLDYPYATVSRGLADARGWCDVLILPYNTKHCAASTSGAQSALAVRIGRKADQDPKDAYPIDFGYRVQARTAEYFRTVLEAPDGPLGTKDYRIVLEAIPVDANRTFIHLGYTYSFGTMARIAMQAYLATAGAKKVGFTVIGRDSSGNPQYVGGNQGATERNTMRYFLAIDAYLGSLSAPEGQRVEKRLNDWYAAAHQYPRQLSEMERGEYLSMKRREAAQVNAALG